MEMWELKAGIELVMFRTDRAISIPALAKAMGCEEQAIEDALLEYEADLSGADRGVQLRHRPEGIRLEGKPKYDYLMGLVIPEWAPKPISQAALETLAIIALKQPITIGAINAIRSIESSGTVQTLRNRKLVMRTSKLGTRREKHWRTTPFFLDAFKLKNLDELLLEGVKERVFPGVFKSAV
jgi:segregation and condensation protein B